MANPAAIVALRFKGTSLQDNPIGVFLELVDGGPQQTPEVRGDDVTIPSRAGQDAMARLEHQRRITLRGDVLGYGVDATGEQVSFETLSQALATLFNPKDVGELEATFASGTVATIDARPLSPLSWDPVILGIAERLQVELLSVAPDWDLSPAGS